MTAMKGSTFFKTSILLLIIGFASAFFAPSEATLGKILWLVYLHIGFFISALIFLLLTIVLNIYEFAFKKSTTLSLKAFGFALICWTIYFLLSAAVAYFGWGGIYWQEPRMKIAVTVLFILTLSYLSGLMFDVSLRKLIYGGASLISIFIWLQRYSIFHPKAPIRNSDSTSIKVLAVVSIASIVISTILLYISVYFRDREETVR